MAGELAIEVRQLVKQFGGQVTAMDQLNLSVPSGETDGLLGPNGAVGLSAVATAHRTRFARPMVGPHREAPVTPVTSDFNL